MGYTPLYDHMLTGTLFGRWPHTGIWACLLSRASRDGVIDEVPASLAAAIGVPVPLLLECISDFMKPDPGSRTKDHDGRRLELLDANRDWGWRVLNHGKYREKARKKNYDDARTESGADAQRKKLADDSREVPTTPAKSRVGPLSEAEANSNKERAKRLPDDFLLTQERRDVAKQEGQDPERTFAKFCDYWRSAGGARARKVDWDATWRNWCRTSKDFGAKQPVQQQPKRSREFGT